jgi:hypothetical protein
MGASGRRARAGHETGDRASMGVGGEFDIGLGLRVNLDRGVGTRVGFELGDGDGLEAMPDVGQGAMPDA